MVAGFMMDLAFVAPDGVVLADTLEGAAVATLRVLGRPAPDTVSTIGPTVAQARNRLSGRRSLVRGLFSGGACFESQVILGPVLGEVRSNTPITEGVGPAGAARFPPVPRPRRGGVHQG